MTNFGGASMPPGITTQLDNIEAALTWHDYQEVRHISMIISGAARDSGNDTVTVLRPGLLLGKLTSGDELKEWDPTATDGTEIIFGILLWDLSTQRLNVDQDRWVSVMIGGPIKGKDLLIPGQSTRGIDGKDLELAVTSQLSQRFDFQDENDSNNQYWGYSKYQTRTAAYTILEADNNTLFSNLGDTGALTFTLPAPRLGYRFGFYIAAAQTVTIAAATGTPIITNGDLAAASVILDGGIGVYCEIIGISATNFIAVICDPGGNVDLTVLNFSGNATGVSQIILPSNVADGLSILDGVFGDYLVFVTTTGSEALELSALLKLKTAGGADAANAVLIGIGTSGDPSTTAIADDKFFEFRCQSTATTGDNRLLYMRYDLAGTGGGECLRAFTKLTGSVGTARGGHVSLNVSTGNISGLGVGFDAQLMVGASTALAGTVFAGQSNINVASGGTLAGTHAIHSILANGTGAAAVLNAIAFQSADGAGDGKMIDNTAVEAGDGDGSIRVLIDEGAGYLVKYLHYWDGPGS